ncbi:hypothetical protein KEM52_000211 [Ascosphaera acerosa]|nr:hypothetical protein KEM52_000211 [Ascosphaera acerosa]
MTMADTARHSIACTGQSNLSTPTGSYILSICRIGTDALAAISSDNSLRVFDKRTLRLRPGAVFHGIHPAATAKGESGATALCSYESGSSSLAVTGGRDGLVKLWDPRTQAGAAMTLKTGTLNMWDVRSPGKPTLSYTESHNDDITVLEFSSFNPRLLLSGSTDTLVNIYDTAQADEEDALKQVISHGSVHRAGFLSDKAAYVLSHDEHFAIHPLNAFVRGEATTVEQAEKVAEEPSPVDFGDVRDQLGCSYVAQVARGPDQRYYVAGGMTDQKRFSLTPIAREPRWHFDQASRVDLAGAHEEEVVREVLLDGDSKSMFTCGEDGFVRVWRMPEDMTAADAEMQDAGVADPDGDGSGDGGDDGDRRDGQRHGGADSGSRSKHEHKHEHERKKRKTSAAGEKKEAHAGKHKKRRKHKERGYQPY